MGKLISGLMITMLLAAMPAGAQEDNDAGLNIAPLINPDAPRLAVWFVAQPGISIEDAAAVESQVFESLLNRHDIRLLGRDAVSKRLAAGKHEKLLQCRGGERCLLEIGRALGVEKMVGVIMRQMEGEYRLEITSLMLKNQPRQLNSVVEGTLQQLLVGGINVAITAIFDNSNQYAPLPVKQPKPTPAVTAKKPAARGKRLANPVPTAPATWPAIRQQPSPPPTTAASSRNEKAAVSRAAPARLGFLRRHWGSALSLGVGVACLGSGIGLGVRGQQIADEQSRQYDPGKDSTGRSYTTAANVLFGLAGAAAVASVVLFLWVENDDPGDDALTILPTASGLQAVGRF